MRETTPRKSDKKSSTSPWLFFGGGLLVVSVICFLPLAIYTELSPLVAAAISINIGEFILCGYDKSIAGGKSLRVPERILIAGALIGGSAGLLAGMTLFRHKTQKKSFQFGLALVLVAQVVIVRMLTAAE